jgi:hypothetical protein
MFLADTNVFLEGLLEQDKVETIRQRCCRGKIITTRNPRWIKSRLPRSNTESHCKNNNHEFL